MKTINLRNEEILPIEWKPYTGETITVRTILRGGKKILETAFYEDRVKATPSFTEMTLYISATDFSLSTTQWETVLPASLQWTGVNATLIWTNATGALT